MHGNRIAGLAFALGALILGNAWAATDGMAAGQGRLLMDSGVAHERLGEHAAAIVDFTQALAQRSLTSPDRVRAIFDRGVAFDALGRTQDALADYSAAIRLQPDFAPALNNRANVYRRQGKLALAKRDYLVALTSRNAAREYPYFGLGQIAQAQSDSETARDYYRKALLANPGYALAAQSLAALDSVMKPVSYAVHPLPAKRESTVPKISPQPAQANAPAPTQVHLVSPTHAPAPLQTAAKGAGPPLRKTILDSGAKRTAIPSIVPAAQIQLGAFRDQASAMEGWSKFAARADGLLGGFSPHIVPADLPGKGRFWRLRVDVTDKAEARKLCAALFSHGLVCLVVSISP